MFHPTRPSSVACAAYGKGSTAFRQEERGIFIPSEDETFARRLAAHCVLRVGEDAVPAAVRRMGSRSGLFKPHTWSWALAKYD